MIIRKIKTNQINPAAYNPRIDLQPGDSRQKCYFLIISEQDSDMRKSVPFQHHEPYPSKNHQNLKNFPYTNKKKLNRH